jgi:outer membrane protein OmpA-like peptidoglycan-associated protein
VVGYTDSRGSDKNNQKLSENRAESVKKYLVGEAIAPEKITSEGKGKADPVGDNKTKEGQFQNRRVVLKIK